MTKKRAPDFVPLPQAVSEIQTSRKCDAATARQIVKDAHQLGDLDLRLRRPDGSTDDQLDRNFWNASPWSDPDLIFETGIVDAEVRHMPAGSLRRVRPTERCRVVIPRENLDAFHKASVRLRKSGLEKKRRKAKQVSRAGAPERHDWEEGELFVMQELKTRGSPLDKNNQTEGWKTISDVARLLIKHLEKLSKDGIGPDESTARGYASRWITKFKRKRN